MSSLPFGLLACCISLILTRVLIKINITDTPNARSSHTFATPRAGGLAIVISFFIILFFNPLYFPFKDSLHAWMTILMCVGMLSIIGLIDDIKSIPSIGRLISHVLMMSLLIKNTGGITSFSLPLVDYLPSFFLGSLSLIWAIGFMNCFNFMDGINGLTGCVSLVSIFFLATLCWIHEVYILMPIYILLSGSILGFLYFNFSKGRIFLGDVGSIFLGALFASLAMLLTRPEFGGISFWTFPVLFFIYLFDTSITLIRRLYRKKNIFQAHREHLYQLLVQLGWSHKKVTGLYGMFFMIQGFLALSMQYLSPVSFISIYSGLILTGGIYAHLVLRCARQKGLL